MIRGKGSGIEIVFTGLFAEALDDLRRRLAAGSDFYRGTEATVLFETAPHEGDLEAIRAVLDQAGIVWDGTAREHSKVAALPVRERRDAAHLSDSARSLVADFAGARADLAQRRHRTPKRRADPLPAVVATPLLAPASDAPAPAPAVLYHRGTLRGGQALANVGHVVVVGDVNPGAELVAGGDIVVFGALRGVAHAGAQGDVSARVFALVLEPTQLRIATTIAAGSERAGAPIPEEAFLDGERIAIVAAGTTSLRTAEPA